MRSGNRQQDAFGHQLPDQAAARRSDGHAHGEFTLAGGCARQHQVGEIGAGDSQHKAGDGQEQQQRLPVLAAHQETPLAAGAAASLNLR